MINDTTFNTSINITTVMETEILPLTVRLKIGLSFEDADPYHQAIALERVRYTINILFRDAIFGSRKNPLLRKLKTITTTRVAECFDEPYDQFLAMLVYYKLSAVLAGKGAVEFITISGDSAGDDLEYSFEAAMLNSNVTDDDLVWITNMQKSIPELKSLWYHRGDTSLNEDIDIMEPTWEMLNLTWEKAKPAQQVYPKKDNVTKFEPKIIK